MEHHHSELRRCASQPLYANLIKPEFLVRAARATLHIRHWPGSVANDHTRLHEMCFCRATGATGPERARRNNRVQPRV